MRSSPTTLVAAAGLCLALPACGSEAEISTAEARSAAEQRVREKYGLPPQAPLSTEIFVGEPRDGEPVLCGTTRPGEGAGQSFPPQRFVAATDPARWLVFEQANDPVRTAQPNMFLEWGTHCAGEEGDNAEEPLAPTEVGEER